MKNVFEAADARQKLAKKRSLHVVNEHFEPVFNAATATQIVFQQAARNLWPAESRLAACATTGRQAMGNAHER